mgnify:CR=1 FL=1
MVIPRGRSLARMLPVLMLLGAVMAPLSASAMCWEEASTDYGIPVDVLKAVAKTESGFNPKALNKNTNGTYDIGLMQINSGHLGTLSRHGIKEADLFDPCTNIRVGAWLLADSFSRRGATWDAVGAYNAACSQLKGKDCIEARAQYAWRVYRQLPAQRSAQFGKHLVSTATTIPSLMSVRVSP